MADSKPKLKVIVFHTTYGCDTGCCGHTIMVDGGLENDLYSFTFDHPDDGQDHKEFALEFAKEWAKQNLDENHSWDLDWDNCEIGYW